jgi:hypothetical protein
MHNPNLNGSREESKLASRNKMQSHLFGFFKSFSEACILHFHFTNHDECPRNLADISRAQLLVFAVRSLETLMRDCLLTCTTQDEGFKDQLLQTGWKPKDGKFDAENSLHYERLISKFSMQNLQTVEKCFEIFFGISLFEKLASGGPHIILKLDENDSLYPTKIDVSSFPADFRESVHELFQYRHEVIHNAHFNLEMPQTQLRYFIELVLYFGQLLCLNVGNNLIEGAGNTTSEIRAGEALFAVKFSEYAKFMLKIKQPSSEEAAIKAGEIIQNHEQLEQQEDYPDSPKNRMGIGPFFLSFRDLLRLKLEQGCWDTFEPEKSAHIMFLSTTGHIEAITIRRT